MDETRFRAELTASGFSQIETKTIDPRPANPDHAHDHDIRGLVLDGLFIVRQNDQPVSYHPGEIFAVPSGIEHSEEIGPAGAHVVIGRRWATPAA